MRGLAKHLSQLFNRRLFLRLVLSGAVIPGSKLFARLSVIQTQDSTQPEERTTVKNNAIKINEKDNVVIAIRPLTKGEGISVDGRIVCKTVEGIELGHKIALEPIQAGAEVVRYGEPIVRATHDIARGEWVHVHNTEPIP
jgi:hypothetical protein